MWTPVRESQRVSFRARLPYTALYEPGATRQTFSNFGSWSNGPIAQLTVMEKVLSANAPRLSVARTTNENVPRVVGVLVICPGLAESRNPGGSYPERSVHV